MGGRHGERNRGAEHFHLLCALRQHRPGRGAGGRSRGCRVQAEPFLDRQDIAAAEDWETFILSPDRTRILTGSADYTAAVVALWARPEAGGCGSGIRATVFVFNPARSVPPRCAATAMVFHAPSVAFHRSWPVACR